MLTASSPNSRSVVTGTLLATADLFNLIPMWGPFQVLSGWENLDAESERAAVDGRAVDGAARDVHAIGVLGGDGAEAEVRSGRRGIRQVGEIHSDFYYPAASVSPAPRTMTFVPTSTTSKSSATSSFSIRMHPEETALPIERGSFVPWIRYKVSLPSAKR